MSSLNASCAACGFENNAKARYCGGCGITLEQITSSAPQEDAGERRQITLLFADIVASSQLAERLDAEDLRQVVSSYHRRCDQVAASFGGHVAQHLGDGTLIYFGYPMAFEDAARRAVSTGLRLVEAARHLAEELPQLVDVGLEVRVGIHTGSVVIGWIGGESRREKLAVGDAPNLAARIQGLAQPGTVVVSASTERLIRGSFHLAPLEAVTPKNFSEPVSLFRVIGPTDESEPLAVLPATGSSPLVGREHEQRVLLDGWSRARAGESPILLVLGEPGIGKTRTVAALRDSIACDAPVTLVARCAGPHQATVLHPFVRCLEAHLFAGEAAPSDYPRLLRRLAQDGITDEEAVRVLALLLSIKPDAEPVAAAVPQALRAATFQILHSWLSKVAQRTAILIVEDLHWADASTLALLGEINQRLIPGLLVVLTARPEFQNPWPVSERFQALPLARLDSKDHSLAIASHVLSGLSLPSAVLEQIAQRSLGVPLFIEEMTKAVVESGPSSDAAGAHTFIPQSLYDSLTSRIDRLGSARGVAQLAAVVGQEFRYDVLLEVWKQVEGALPNTEVLGAHLKRLVESEIVVERGTAGELKYEFKHVLLQQAAYDTLLRSRRKELHGVVASTLAERFSHLVEIAPQVMAAHWSKAGAHGTASERWRDAALRATATSAHAEAIQALTSALVELGLLPPDLDRSRRELELSCTLGLEYVQTLGFAAKEVEQTYGRAMSLCDELGSEMGRRPEVLYGVWLVHFVRGELSPAERLAVHFRALADRSADPAVLLIAHASLGTFHFYRAEYAAAMVHLERAEQLISLSDPKKQHAELMQRYRFEGLLYGPMYRAWCQALTGNGAGALKAWTSALDLATRLDDPYILAQVRAIGSSLLRDMGRLPEAKALADEARGGSAAFSFWYACATAVSGWILSTSGEVEKGIGQIGEALAILKAIGANVPYPYFSSYLADVLLRNDRLDEAEAVLAESLAMTERNIDRNFAAELLGLRGEVCARRGDQSAAEASLRHAMHLTSSQGARFLHLKSAQRLSRLLGSAEGERLLAAAREGVDMPGLFE